jgi:hypothetical protein
LVTEEEVVAVGGANPYVTNTLTFEATGTEGDLVFAISAIGDATFLIDDVHLKPSGAPPPRARFVRGDADSSASINLTDGIVILNFLFTGGRAPACMDAADTDDSGQRLNLTDAVGIFSWLFQGGRPPATPSPNAPTYLAASCGADPTPDDGLDCATTAGTCR